MTAFVRPEITDVNRGFWDGAAARRLTLQCCDACGEVRYPPAQRCPRCLSTDWSWHDVSGRGEIFSFTYVHQKYHQAWADRVPYNVVLVQLDEGPRMVSNVVPLSRNDLKVGLRVRVVFDDEDGLTVPRFEVDEEAAK